MIGLRSLIKIGPKVGSGLMTNPRARLSDEVIDKSKQFMKYAAQFGDTELQLMTLMVEDPEAGHVKAVGSITNLGISEVLINDADDHNLLLLWMLANNLH